MRAAINRVDIICKGENIFRVAVIVLERKLHVHVFLVGFGKDRRGMESFLVPVQVFDEFGDPALITKFSFLVVPLIFQDNCESFIQKREFTEPLRQRVVIKLDGTEDGTVRKESDFRSAAVGLSGLFQRTCRLAESVGLLPGVLVAPYLQLQPFGQSVYNRYADAVQTARNIERLAV